MESERRKIGKALMFAVLIATFVFASVGCASATTIYVPEGGNQTIRQAVNNASAGDTIIVRDGTYPENVDVNVDNLTIQSKNGSANCIVRAANPNDHVFNVTADWVNISGFTVKDATAGDYTSAIYLYGVEHCNISNNIVLDSNLGIYLNVSSNVTIDNNIASDSEAGIALENSTHNNVTNNKVNNTNYAIALWRFSHFNRVIDNTIFNTTNVPSPSGNYSFAIEIMGSCNNLIDNNYISNTTASGTNAFPVGIFIASYYGPTNNNTVTDNKIYNTTASGETSCGFGIYMSEVNYNTLINNTVNSNDIGISLYISNNTNITSNTISNNNKHLGIQFHNSSDNLIYNNYFSNKYNVMDNGNNIWNITKTAGPNIVGGSYLGGNYWSDYAGEDLDGDGLGDTLIPYNSSGNIQNGGDWLPLVKPSIFDADTGTYPSISGTHNGTITPICNVNVSRLYTYPCTGTGGHTEYVKIWNITGWNVTATWDGYQGDWHNISFDEPFTLKAGEEYSYTIITGSYPQIHHNRTLLTENGWINCTEFTDANGRTYNNWIPAIRLS